MTMGKRQFWFTWVKSFFLPEPSPKKSEKQKSKRWRWLLLHRFKFRHHHPSLEVSEKTLGQATEEHRRHAVAVAVATAAAAEAAVAAANAAAEVVRMTSGLSEIHAKNRFFAAVRIQSAYKGHLARKALSALKGVVKLQAVVRGELVRRRVFMTLPLMSLLQPYSRTRVQRKRVSTLFDHLSLRERSHNLRPNDMIKSEEGRLHRQNQKSWDMSLISEENTEALCLQKQEAIAKQERMKQYLFSHRERRKDHGLKEPMSHKENTSSRFDQILELESLKHEENEKPKHLKRSNTTVIEGSQMAQLKLRNSCMQEKTGEIIYSPFSHARWSFSHMKEKSLINGHDRSLPNFPSFQMYMAPTESTRARCRSLSTPKQRLRLCKTYSSVFEPYKFGPSSRGSVNGDF